MSTQNSFSNILRKTLHQVSYTLANSNALHLLEGILSMVQEHYPNEDDTNSFIFLNEEILTTYPLLKYKRMINYVFLNNETLDIISNKVYVEKISDQQKAQYMIKQLCKFKILTHEVADIYYINPLMLSLIRNKNNESVIKMITKESLELKETKYKVPEILFPATDITIACNQLILQAMFQITSKTVITIFQHIHTIIMYDIITKKYIFSGNDKFIEELAIKSNKSISTIRKTIAELCKINDFSKTQILSKTKVPGHYSINEIFIKTIDSSINEISLHFNFSQNKISAKSVSFQHQEQIDIYDLEDNNLIIVAEYDELEKGLNS